MLIQFKSDFEKIAMGLLSYIEDLKETSRLKEEIELYKEDDDRDLYLWKSNETDDFCGVIGIEKGDGMVLVRHISVNPSYRNEGIAGEMIDAVADEYQVNSLMSTLETSELVNKWQKRQKESGNLVENSEESKEDN